MAESIGCEFASITSPEKNEEAMSLIQSFYGASGEDFVWFGASEVGEHTDNSTWEWVDGSPDFGGGQNANNLGYQNWWQSQPDTGLNAGLNSGTNGEDTDGYWSDQNPGNAWHGLYQCCPDELPIDSVLITEIMLNPSCGVDKGQWIELFNAGNMPINLSAYRLDESSSGRVTLPTHILNPGDYYIIGTTIDGCGGLNADQAMTAGTFVINTEETLTLTDGYNNVVDVVTYNGNALSTAYANGGTASTSTSAYENVSIARKTNATDGTPIDTGNFDTDWGYGGVGGTPRAGYKFHGPARLVITEN